MSIKSLFKPYHYDEGRFSAKFIALTQLGILAALWLLAPARTGIPSPGAIVASWNKLALEQGLLVELGHSILTIWQALLYSTLLSCGISYLVTADIFKPVGQFVSSMRFLGFTGLTFLFTLWTSSGHQLKLLLLTFGMTVFLTRSTVDEVKSIAMEQIDYAKSLGLSGWRITYETIMRGRLHVMLDLVRQNAAIGWTMLTMVEGLVRSEGGVGAMLINQNKYFILSGVFAIQLTILAYGLAQDYALNLVRAIACPYSELNRSDK